MPVSDTSTTCPPHALPAAHTTRTDCMRALRSSVGAALSLSRRMLCALTAISSLRVAARCSGCMPSSTACHSCDSRSRLPAPASW